MMTIRSLMAWVLAGAAPLALAAPASYEIEDLSSVSLIDKPAVLAAWKQALPEAKLRKLYPVAKWGFLSQVEGGVVDGQICVVTARVSMLPKTSPTRRLVWEPAKTSTAVGGKLVSDAAECAALARGKLDEALRSLTSSLVR